MAFADYLASESACVSLYNRTPSRISELTKDPHITLKGLLSRTGRLETVTDDLAEAVIGSEVIFVTTSADAHEEILQRVEPHLKPGQVVVLNPGDVGDYITLRSLDMFKRGMILSETNNLLYGCRKTDERTVDISGIKDKIFIYGVPEYLKKAFEAFFPQFVFSNSPLETALRFN